MNSAIGVFVAMTGKLDSVVKLVKMWPTTEDWFALTDIDGTVGNVSLNIADELSTSYK